MHALLCPAVEGDEPSRALRAIVWHALLGGDNKVIHRRRLAAYDVVEARCRAIRCVLVGCVQTGMFCQRDSLPEEAMGDQYTR